MARTFSATLKQALAAPETGEVPLTLLTIDHADLGAPLRVVNNLEDVTSRGDLFVAYPFELTWPADDDERPPAPRLVIDNVDRSISDALRAITSPATVTVELVLASDPDTVEHTIVGFEVGDVVIGALQVEAGLGLETLENEPYPAGRMTPGNFAGLF